MQAIATHDDSSGQGLIKAKHGGDSQVALNDLVETPEEIAAKFNGSCKRLTAAQAFMVYLRSGGVVLGLLSLGIFAFTQTTRIMGDWWIRYAVVSVATVVCNQCAVHCKKHLLVPL